MIKFDEWMFIQTVTLNYYVDSNKSELFSVNAWSIQKKYIDETNFEVI